MIHIPKGIKPKRSYRLLTNERLKIKEGDYLRHSTIPWQPSDRLINYTVGYINNKFTNVWYACRRINK